MAFFDSEVSVFQLNDGSTLRDISASVVGVDGLPGPRTLNEVTALGDGGRKFSPGLEDVTITLDVIYTSGSATSIDEVMDGISRGLVAVAFDYGPEGIVNPMPRYSGTCWVENWTHQSRVGNRVEASITLRVEGVVTIGVYA